MDPEQLAHPPSLIRIHAVRLQTLLQVEKLTANSMDPDQTARMCKLFWIHAGRKRTMLVLSLRDSNVVSHAFYLFSVCHLAGKLLRAIKERQPDVGITDKDILCVEIAGLCHDLGKLPYYQ
jgi:HD superfamily phosphodiesterase